MRGLYLKCPIDQYDGETLFILEYCVKRFRYFITGHYYYNGVRRPEYGFDDVDLPRYAN